MILDKSYYSYSTIILISKISTYSLPKGKVKIKSLPIPFSLSTQISPPSLSKNSLQSVNPKPDPFSLSVPRVDSFCSMLNNFQIVLPIYPSYSN